MTSDPPVSEQLVRAMRDDVFGVPATDDGWECVKKHWMSPDSIDWLFDRVKVPMEKVKDK